jgi:hypothetical protein
MDRTFLFIGCAFAIGLGVGIYVGISIQSNLQEAGATTIILAILGGIGTVTALSGILIPYFKEPVLEYTKIGIWKDSYYLGVRKKRGKGKALGCEGYLTIDGTEIKNTISIWTKHERSKVDIDDVPIHLHLFKRIGDDIIVYIGQFKEPEYEPRRNEDVINKQLTVKITSDNAEKLKHSKKAIKEIMSVAMPLNKQPE